MSCVSSLAAFSGVAEDNLRAKVRNSIGWRAETSSPEFVFRQNRELVTLSSGELESVTKKNPTVFPKSHKKKKATLQTSAGKAPTGSTGCQKLVRRPRLCF